jgi:hypothetical protein
MKELQGALFRLSSARSACDKAELSELSNHINKINIGIRTVKNHLQKIYSSAPVSYNIKKMYDDLETVIGDSNE